jgi:hypothetical protein
MKDNTAYLLVGRNTQEIISRKVSKVGYCICKRKIGEDEMVTRS